MVYLLHTLRLLVRSTGIPADILIFNQSARDLIIDLKSY